MNEMLNLCIKRTLPPINIKNEIQDEIQESEKAAITATEVNDLTLGDNSWRKWTFSNMTLTSTGPNGGYQSASDSYSPIKLFDTSYGQSNYHNSYVWESVSNTNKPNWLEIKFNSECYFTGYGFYPGYSTSYTFTSWDIYIDDVLVVENFREYQNFQTGKLSAFNFDKVYEGNRIKFKFYDITKHICLQKLCIFGEKA